MKSRLNSTVIISIATQQQLPASCIKPATWEYFHPLKLIYEMEKLIMKYMALKLLNSSTTDSPIALLIACLMFLLYLFFIILL